MRDTSGANKERRQHNETGEQRQKFKGGGNERKEGVGVFSFPTSWPTETGNKKKTSVCGRGARVCGLAQLCVMLRHQHVGTSLFGGLRPGQTRHLKVSDSQMGLDPNCDSQLQTNFLNVPFSFVKFSGRRMDKPQISADGELISLFLTEIRRGARAHSLLSAH